MYINYTVNLLNLMKVEEFGKTSLFSSEASMVVLALEPHLHFTTSDIVKYDADQFLVSFTHENPIYQVKSQQSVTAKRFHSTSEKRQRRLFSFSRLATSKYFLHFSLIIYY